MYVQFKHKCACVNADYYKWAVVPHEGQMVAVSHSNSYVNTRVLLIQYS